jgi:hypothetical protein
MERSSSTRRCARRIPFSTGWVEYGQLLRLTVTDWVVATRRDSPLSAGRRGARRRR